MQKKATYQLYNLKKEGVYSRIFNILTDSKESGILSRDQYEEMAMSLIQRYSWIPPTEEILQLIVETSQPLIEMGAGRGYWAHLISKRAKIVCYDKYRQHDTFYPVAKGGPECLADLPESSSLLICCPQYRSDMLLESLQYFGGNTFHYVGEIDFKLNFPETLEKEITDNWELVLQRHVPGWPNTYNVYLKYVRKT